MENTTTLTLVWSLVGLALLGAEMMTGTFILLFFGISALVVAVLRLIGLDSLAIEVILFAIIGSMMIFFFRPKIRAAMEQRHKGYDVDKNATFTLSADIPAHGSANILYQGTTWTALNGTDALMSEGQKVRVTKVEGIKIHVLPADTKPEVQS